MPEPALPSDCRILRPTDSAFPAALRHLADPPRTLWVRGPLPEPASSVAVVGTRTATPGGIETATRIARAAAERGLTVVSGLSPGIDIAAHRAAIEAGGTTVAIIGSGIDRPTPREHARDAEVIVAQGGCLLTEQPPGTRRSPSRLAARNRLQTALSALTVVVQTGTASGTMRTAAHALEQHRPLAVVVPPEAERDHPGTAGNLALLGVAGVHPLPDDRAVDAALDAVARGAFSP